MNQLEIEVEIMRAAGLSYGEIAKLAELKKRADAGEVDELTTDYKRRMFQKRRFEAGDLTDDFNPGDEERYAAIIEQGGASSKHQTNHLLNITD